MTVYCQTCRTLQKEILINNCSHISKKKIERYITIVKGQMHMHVYLLAMPKKKKSLTNNDEYHTSVSCLSCIESGILRGYVSNHKRYVSGI